MSIRLKLLLLGLATLVLRGPVAVTRARWKTALREGEQSSLLSVAQTIAASLQGRGDLLYRQPAPAPSPEEAPTDTQAAATQDAKPSPYDLRPVLLTAQPFLDGYVEEWPQNETAWRYFTRDRHQFGILTGVFERMLYVMLDVHDEHLVFDSPARVRWIPALSAIASGSGLTDRTAMSIRCSSPPRGRAPSLRAASRPANTAN